MLEKILRSLPDKFSWKMIFDKNLGDEGLLLLIENLLEDLDKNNPIIKYNIMNNLTSRNFYKTVYRITQETTLTNNATKKKKEAIKPDGRLKIEKEILDKIKDNGGRLEDGAINVSCLPSKMQWKIPKALIEWADSDILPLYKLPEEKHYADEIAPLTLRYSNLWSLSVYLHPSYMEYISAIEEICENDIFQVPNDRTLKPYLRQKWELFYRPEYRLSNISKVVKAKVADGMYNLAAKGKTKNKSKLIDSMTDEKLVEVIVKKSKPLNDENQLDLK